MYIYADPDELAKSPTPPVGVDTALQEVFGDRLLDDDGQLRIKVRLHPFLKRWCAYERVRKEGQIYWKVFWICQDDPTDLNGELPRDYQNLPSNERKWFEHFSGLIGEFRVPHKRDFEELEKFDTRRHSSTEICTMLEKQEDSRDAERERQMRDYEYGFHEYLAWMAINEANRRAGSGQRMQSVPTVLVRENQERYFIQERDGYKVKCKRGTALEAVLKAEGAANAEADDAERFARLEAHLADFQAKRRAAELMRLAKSTQTGELIRPKRTL